MDGFALLVDDLVAEHRALEDVLVKMTAAQWDRETHAPGWLVRDQVTHLAHFDAMATLAMVDADRFRAEATAKRGDDSRQSYEQRYLRRGRLLWPADLLAWWRRAAADLIAAARAVDVKSRLPWYGPDMS